MRSLQLLRLLGANDCCLLLLLLNWHIHLQGQLVLYLLRRHRGQWQ
jgi:hypothetical protein